MISVPSQLATNNTPGQYLTGRAAELAGVPRDPAVMGGVNSGQQGVSSPIFPQSQPVQQEQPDPYEGLGALLEEDDQTVFNTVDELYRRQELIKKSHLAQDTHWTRVKWGYPWSKLEKMPDQGIYKSSLPYGSSAISIQAIPNKACDLVNKCAETLLVDFPQPSPEPLNDSEEAEAAAEMAERFLTQDAGESGTNDTALFYNGVDRALTTASTYVHGWVDPVGGGCIPLQIKAHPEAQSPENPLVGPDGMPTTDYILRYVTQDQQFTDDPSQAAPQWQPKIRGDVLGREHVRVFPETQDVSNCQKVIITYFCTLAEAKSRWQLVGQMNDDQLSELTGWQPLRYLDLLPPAQRSRFKIGSGDVKQKNGSGDERIIFYHLLYQKASPEYPKGAAIVVSGANQGVILDKALLYADVEVQSSDGSGPKQEPRCMDVPLSQIRPRVDSDDHDPTGRPYIELFGGSVEFMAMLETSYLEAMDQILHIEKYTPATSPIEGWQVAEARASGDHIPILSAQDKPTYGNVPPLPPGILDVLQYVGNSTDSIASQNKPLQGGNDQQEVSGRARAIAVQQAMIGLNRMQGAVNAAYERWCRIKIQLAMRDFTTPQEIRYVGEDGAYRVEEWKGADFALVGDVGIKAGTGTMMTPESKIQYVASLKNLQLISDEQAADAARPTFSDALGLPDDPHQQYVERCVSEWLKGPPQGWAEAQQQYQTQVQQYQIVSQQAQQQVATAQQVVSQSGGDPSQVPRPQLPPPPQAPWSPFQPRPNDQELAIASLWAMRLSKVISSVKYGSSDPTWRQLLDARYSQATQTIQQYAPAPALPRGVSVTEKGDASTVGAEIMAAVHPQAGQAAPPAPQPPRPLGMAA